MTALTPWAVVLAILLIAVGGAIGATARWAIAEYGFRLALRSRPEADPDLVKPWMTFAANLLACFLLGIIVSSLGSATGTGELLYLLLGVGVCGAMSTLSTAAMDLVDLVRRGTATIATGYLLLSIGGGMAMLWVGLVVSA